MVSFPFGLDHKVKEANEEIPIMIEGNEETKEEKKEDKFIIDMIIEEDENELELRYINLCDSDSNFLNKYHQIDIFKPLMFRIEDAEITKLNEISQNG